MVDINVNQSNLTFYFPTDKTDIMAVGFDKNRWQITSHHHHHHTTTKDKKKKKEMNDNGRCKVGGVG